MSLSPAPTPKRTGKPTGKGSRGPYKKTLQRQQAAQAAAAGGYPLSPNALKPKSKSGTPKLSGSNSTAKKRKKAQDDDDHRSRTPLGSSRAGSIAASSRGGTPTFIGRFGEGDDDDDDGEGSQRGRRRTFSDDESDEEAEEEEEDAFWEGGVSEVRRRLKTAKDSQMFLVNHLDDTQRSRFDAWKTSSFSKPQIKKFIIQHTGNSISDELAQIVGGVSKVYVGLIISKARTVQENLGQIGPLTPFHLREAHRMYVQESGKGFGLTGRRPGAGGKAKKSLFIR